MSENNQLKVVARRVIPASPDVVFEAWTQPDLLKKWFGPPGVTCTEAEVDLRVGGAYRLRCMVSSSQTVWIHGIFEAVDRPSRLQYTWGHDLDTPGTERVTVEFKPTTGGVEVTIVHEYAPNEEARQSRTQGWLGCLSCLETYLAGPV